MSQQPPSVVILNGTSSAGKTSIAESLLAQDPRFIHFSMDIYIKENGLDDPDNPAHANPGKVYADMVKSAEDLLSSDHTVVIDIFAPPKVMKMFLDELEKYNPFLVHVTAPLEVLEQREKMRGDRPPGLAKKQFEIVREAAKYGLTVDTSVASADDIARHIMTHITGLNTSKNPIDKLAPIVKGQVFDNS